MVLLSKNRIAWQYHSDNGRTYRVAAMKAMTDQGVLGGEAWDGTSPAKPGTIKMRRITVHNATLGSRVVPVYSTDADILTPETEVTCNALTDQAVYKSTGEPIPEKRPRVSVTTQSA